MPRISEFYGIVIARYYNDHESAHFHVVYAGQRAIVGIESGQILRGTLPRRTQALVDQWATGHRAERRENWKRARAHAHLVTIEPLDWVKCEKMEVVVQVKVLRPYILEVTFDDGTRRVIDVEPYLYGEVFEPLKVPEGFAEVTVDPVLGTIVWPNGADFSPEFLYAQTEETALRPNL
ncbi:MAG TPA: DUF2442 domain-containing protein [Dehalococcoidia bacterium]|nr:DUF2442 domain-containing protein [Dehalococcoidia bacterium]